MARARRARSVHDVLRRSEDPPIRLLPVAAGAPAERAADDRPPIAVLVAERHAFLRDALVALLRHEPGLAVTPCRGWAEVKEAVARSAPDVVLLHRRLTEGTDGDTVAALRALAPDAAILLTGMQYGAQFRPSALRDGASGYLPLDSRPEELLAAIHAAAERTPRPRTTSPFCDAASA